MAEQVLTRRVLYDLVWSKPMTKVAEEFGISDVGLKKVCDKHRVPTPPRGYWARKDAGQPVKQARFHETADPQEERVVILGSRSSLSPEVQLILDQERERRKTKPKPTFFAAEAEHIEALQDVHPWVEPTARTLRKAKPDNEGVVRANGPNHCGIEVGSASVERVIVVLDALVRALEARGQKLEPGGTGMHVTIPPDTASFTLNERIEKRAHTPTMEELAKEERIRKKRERDGRLGIWSFDQERAYPEFDFIRTGELGIEIENRYVTGLRRSWKDGRRQRLEGLIEDIAGGIITYLAGIKADREERERRQREWRRQEELRALARARDQREKRRHELLERLTAASTEADELRSLLNRLRERMPASPSGELVRLLAWTEANLQRLEDELAAEGIVAAVQEHELFPEVDPLAAPDLDEE